MFGGARRATCLGSGVVVSSDGYVLTNNHVVGDNMVEITVALADKRELRARVVGTDPWTDIALLKVNATGLPVIPWGDSSKLKVAEWVLAIGNPFQLNQTVTLGIVSAHRPRQRRRGRLRGLHPDRRRHQPRQLGRRAHQRARRTGGHQHGDLQRRAGAIRASGSPCRATWPAA